MSPSRTQPGRLSNRKCSGAAANSPERDRLVEGVDMDNRTCTIEGCTAPYHARGWCSRHYSTWRRTGDASTAVTRHFRTPAEAFDARTERVSGCLLWCGSKSREGYGFITVNGRLEMAHRYAWVVEYGPIPSGHEVDHVCGNRACCDARHLRLATRHENMRNRTGAQSTSSTGVRNVRCAGDRFEVIVGREYVGSFRDIESARSAAEVARLAQFGQFAGRG